MRSKPRLPDDAPNLPQEHAAKEFFVLLGGVSLVAALLFVVAIWFVDVAVTLAPAGWDANLKTSVAGLGRSGGTMERRLQRLAEELAQGWESNPYQLRVRLIEGAEPNAFALPGGRILVTQGLVDNAESENELAFILAHEIGHLRNRDHLRNLGRGALLSMVTAALGISTDELSVLSSLGQLAALRSSRAQEISADEVGVDLVHRHYGHVAGSWDFFRRLLKGDGIESAIPVFFSTHPGSKERILEIEEYARSKGYASDGALTGLH